MIMMKVRMMRRVMILTMTRLTTLLSSQLRICQTERLIWFAFLKSETMDIFLCLGDNGALFRMNNVQSDQSRDGLKAIKTLRYIYCHCFSLFRDSTHLRKHISKLHMGPVACKMCKCFMDDIAALNKHKKTCFYSCGVPECELKHSRLITALNHKKKYLKSLE